MDFSRRFSQPGALTFTDEHGVRDLVGIAVIGTTIGGTLFYREPATLFKFICMLLILAARRIERVDGR